MESDLVAQISRRELELLHGVYPDAGEWLTTVTIDPFGEPAHLH